MPISLHIIQNVISHDCLVILIKFTVSSDLPSSAQAFVRTCGLTGVENGLDRAAPLKGPNAGAPGPACNVVDDELDDGCAL